MAEEIGDPKVEIDTSPPFESVKEAVHRFGGGGAPWIPLHLLRQVTARHDLNKLSDMAKLEEEATQLERDLLMKEQQTHNVLKELEAAKLLLETLKLDLMPKKNSSALCSIPSSAHMFAELNQAKLNLNRTSSDLALIQASLQSLNCKLREDKILLGRTKMRNENFENQDPPEKLGTVDNNVKEFASFEAEEFKRMAEGSRYEVTKAMAEIECTKNGIKMAEMRLYAAKKMEEAAKAVEAIALAQKFTLSNDPARQARDLFHRNEKRGPKVEETTKNVVVEHTRNNNSLMKFKFRNSVRAQGNPQDDATVGNMSLSQMLREQSRVILEPTEEDGSSVSTRKKFGFIQVPVLYNKNNKTKKARS